MVFLAPSRSRIYQPNHTCIVHAVFQNMSADNYTQRVNNIRKSLSPKKGDGQEKAMENPEKVSSIKDELRVLKRKADTDAGTFLISRVARGSKMFGGRKLWCPQIGCIFSKYDMW